MRDATTDGDHGVSGYQRREALEAIFLEALLVHVTGPTDDTWASLRAASADLNAAGTDHFTPCSAWSHDLDVRIGPILDADAASWGNLLRCLSQRNGLTGSDLTERFRDASPFKGKLVVYARSRPGFGTTYRGEFEPILDAALAVHASVSLSGDEVLYVLDRPVPVAEAVQPEDDPGSVGC